MKSKHEKSNGSNSSERDSSNDESMSKSDKVDHDALSIYIGNVDYSATEEELRNTFIGCGEIVRVTIIKNMKTGHPKGAAFIEFTDKDGVQAAMLLNGKEVKGRPLIVTSKKPRPENRQREPRPAYAYDRRPPRPGPPPHYAMPYIGNPGRMPYGGGPPQRGGYYMGSQMHDTRRGHPSPMQMQMDPGRMQPRYDPYRRPEFYDPYMMPRGGPPLPPPPQYYHQEKMTGGHGGGHPSRNQPPQRYSNPYNRR